MLDTLKNGIEVMFMLPSGNDIAKSLEENIAGHNARNAALLNRIVELGASLSEPRTIDVFFWAPSPQAAEALAASLTSLGFDKVIVSSTEHNDYPMSIQGQLNKSPEIVGSERMTLQLVMLASSFNAQYDGWGTQL